MELRIMVSRHSAFYSPLISAIAAGFLEEQRLSADYTILRKGQRSSVLIRDGAVDIVQSAVSSNWKPLQQGESQLPVHFAQINQRDGFFLIARKPDQSFKWKDLEGKSLIADHAPQPLVMLKYAVRLNGVDWRRIDIVDAGSPEEMELAFRRGTADYIHLQAPACDQLEQDSVGRIVVSVGKSMPPVAFSSLCCSRDFLHTERCRSFLEAFRQAREWVRSVRAQEVAQKELRFFPGISVEALTTAIRRYQGLGCWDGESEIPRDLYEQALTVFESAGEINRRYAYEEVCGVAVTPQKVVPPEFV